MGQHQNPTKVFRIVIKKRNGCYGVAMRFHGSRLSVGMAYCTAEDASKVARDNTKMKETKGLKLKQKTDNTKMKETKGLKLKQKIVIVRRTELQIRIN